MSLTTLIAAVLLALVLGTGAGWKLGLDHKQGQWDAANAQATRESLAIERKGVDFNHAAAAARAASAATANTDARARAERVYRATITPPAVAASAVVCAVPDGVRDDLATAISAANAAR